MYPEIHVLTQLMNVTLSGKMTCWIRRALNSMTDVLRIREQEKPCWEGIQRVGQCGCQQGTGGN